MHAVAQTQMYIIDTHAQYSGRWCFALVFVECGKVDWEVGGLRRSGAWVTQRSRFLAFWCDGSHVAFEVNLTFHGDTHIINAYINIYILYMYIQIFRCRYK